MKLTSSTSILSLLKVGMVIKVYQLDDAPYIRSSTTGKRRIRAHRPKYRQHRDFTWSREGLTDALQWAADGWQLIDDPTLNSQKIPRPKW